VREERAGFIRRRCDRAPRLDHGAVADRTGDREIGGRVVTKRCCHRAAVVVVAGVIGGFAGRCERTTADEREGEHATPHGAILVAPRSR
jgi:hypothetical protein